MNSTVKSIADGSPSSGSIITPGDVLRKINGNKINDVLDYEYYSYDECIFMEFLSPGGKVKLIKISKKEGEDPGLEFETFLMDKERRCSNKCIFCFMDQLPDGMRDTLYYKDDDFRLSFLQGNYVTLTNLSVSDMKRIIKLRISPINVSVHTLDRELRCYMLGSKNASRSIDIIMTLVKAGIKLNCQIVCCPGINDGWELSKTIEGLIRLGQNINSVSIVPVGLTGHRRGLTKLQPFDKTLALQTVRTVEHYGNKCLKTRGSSVFFCADELYATAGLELPANKFYEDYPQLENGVGMMRLFISQFEDALSHLTGFSGRLADVSMITGTLAYQYLTNLLITLAKKYGTIYDKVYAIRNEFFGESVTVSGLITGSDIIKQLKGKPLGSLLLIPRNMLRQTASAHKNPAAPEIIYPAAVSMGLPPSDVFLDDITVVQLAYTLDIPIRIINPNGADLLNALTGK